MLKDVLFITKEIFPKVLVKKKNQNEPKKIYDFYRSFQKLIKNIDFVTNHYISLDFTEPYLQNSSCGEPVDKWREVLNRDLKGLNECVKNYLINLASLSYFDIAEIYHSMLYVVFVEKSYNVGFIEPNSCSLKIDCLNLNPKHHKKIDVYERKAIDLSTYESRVNLKNELIKINEELKPELQKLEEYILKRYTIKDLLK